MPQGAAIAPSSISLVGNRNYTLIAVTAWHEAGHAMETLREGWTLISAHVLHSCPGDGLVRQLGVNRYNHSNPWEGRDGLASWKVALDYSLAEVRILSCGPTGRSESVE